MAKAPVYTRNQESVFMDELNHAFGDCTFEMNPKTKEVWVFGYPTGVIYNPDNAFESNVKHAVKTIHEFLIQSV